MEAKAEELRLAAAAEELARQSPPVFKEPPTKPEEVYKELRAEAQGPVELATLVRLRVWATANDGYSVEDAMELVRWLEVQLAEPLGTRQLATRALRNATSKQRALLATLAVLALLAAFWLLAGTTVLAFNKSQPVTVDSLGRLAVDGGERPAAVSAAVSLRALPDYPKLTPEQLRSAKDVVLTHAGSFHFFRVAAVARVMGGQGVRVTGEDGTIVTVEGERVSFVRPWESEQVVSSEDTSLLVEGGASWAIAGAFETLARH